jgi:cell division transport system ATP-binding protein
MQNYIIYNYYLLSYVVNINNHSSLISRNAIFAFNSSSNMTYTVEIKRADIYQGDKQVLKDVNINIGKGEFVYLIGKTGSGKSSLLKCLYGALSLKRGEGSVAGFELNSLDRKTLPLLRRRIGIVFQDFNLLDDRNVGDNLLFVLRATGWKNKAQMAERVDTVLKNVGLSDFQTRLPHQLSGGEQQRIVIARALLNMPELIIADEPTGNLDPDTSDEIILLLKEVCKTNNTSVLLATHDYRILEKYPARILKCQDGEIK